MPRHYSPPTPEREEEQPSEEEMAYNRRLMETLRNLSPHRTITYDDLGRNDEYLDQDDEDLGQFDAQQQWYDEHMRQTQEQQMQANRIGTAFHVHEAFDNIRENLPEITETLGGLDPNLDMNQGYLLDMILRYCNYVLEDHYYAEVKEAEDMYNKDNNKEKLDKTLEFLLKKFEGNLNKIPKILDKLGYIDDSLTDANISYINMLFQFVFQQPDIFQANYVETFIGDTYHAYDGTENTISCVNGITERMLLSIGDACMMYCTMFKKKHRRKPKSATKKKNDRDKNKARKKLANRKTVIKGGRASLYKRCDNPVYRKLIWLFKKEVPDINSLSQKWAASIFIDDYHQDPKLDTITLNQKRRKLAEMNAVDLENDFVTFMVNEYKRYGLTQTAQILKKANEYKEAHVFERKAFG